MLRGFDGNQRAALLISECQRGVIDETLSPFQGLAEQVRLRGIVPRIARLAAAFRKAGLPVVHLHVVHYPDYADVPRTSMILARSIKSGRMCIGTPDITPVEGLEPAEGDIVHARSFALVAFHGTDLDSILRHRNVRTLVLAGVSTNVAISGAALCGSDLGYQAVVPEDCIAGATAESHQFICGNLLPLYSTLTTASEVEAALSARPAAA